MAKNVKIVSELLERAIANAKFETVHGGHTLDYQTGLMFTPAGFAYFGDTCTVEAVLSEYSLSEIKDRLAPWLKDKEGL